jgi:hypothetical protein
VVACGGDPAAVPDLLRWFASETDATVRDALCTQLARHDRDDVVAAMAAALRSPDAAVRAAAVHVLVSARSASARLLPGLVADPDPDVRTLSVMVLAGTPGDQAAALLRTVVRTDENQNVVAAAASELVARFGPLCAEDVLLASVRFPTDPYIAFACREVSGGAGARL